MSDPKSQSQKPQPKTPEQELKELRQLRQFMQKQWELKRLEMVDGRKASITESIKTTAQQVTELSRHKENVKGKAKAEHDQLYTEAEIKMNAAKRGLELAFEQKAEELKEAYDKECHAANQAMQLAVQPFNVKHAETLKGIEEDFEAEMVKIEVAAKQELKKVDEVIVALEAKVEASKPVKPVEKAPEAAVEAPAP